jgi:triacylglycerol lipase
MDTIHMVDAELRPLLEVFPPMQLSMETLEETRGRVFPLPEPDTTRTTQERRTIPGPAGAPDLEVLVYRPKDASGPLACIYHIHGGGYVLGQAKSQEAPHRQISADLNCAIVSVDYRLAPETPFPGPVEDCYAGLAWTVRAAGELGVDASNIGVMGESAGGGLAAALALLARDRGECALAFQHLIYPMLDDRTCAHPDPHPHTGEFIWHAHNNHFGWKSLLGHDPGREGVSPYAAPARAESLAGLPPTFISTGALDLFLEEDIEYARRLIRVGVPTELHVYPGAFHGFDMAPDASVSRQARRDSREALARFLQAGA